MDICVLSSERIPIITAKHTPREIKDPFVLFCSPASCHSSGKVPIIKPTNAQVTSTVFFSSSHAVIPERPTNPTATPQRKTPSISQCLLIPFLKSDKISIIGRYIPKTTQSVPPLIPGSIAPKPR